MNDDDVKSASDSKPSEVSNNDLVSPDEMNLEKAASDEVNETLVYKKNNSAGILKPDIVFFGEGLPELYHQSIGEDKNKCDLLIVIGSSLKVKPVANIPHLLPQSVPQILINREPLKHLNFDIELLGDCDVIVNEILLRLEEKQRLRKNNENYTETSEKLTELNVWSSICKSQKLLKEINDKEAENLLFNNKASLDHSDSSNNSSPDNSTVIFGENQTNKSKDDEDPSENQILDSTEIVEVSVTNKKYTKDYLKESSFLYLKPNMYVFHGAEIQLKQARKKLKKLNKSEEEIVGGVDMNQFELSDDSDDDSDMTDNSDDDDDDEDEDESDEQQTEEDSNMNDEKFNHTEIENKKSGNEIKLKSGDLSEDEDDSDEDDGDFNPDDPDSIPEVVTNFNKKNLIDFLNEDNEFEDEDDDEDFTPETNMDKKQLSEFLNEKFATEKPDM